MRKLQLLTVLVLMFPAAMASSQPEVQIENMAPQPGSPGDTVKIHLVAQNQGSTGSTYEPVKVETGENISDLGRTSMKESFYLCGGCQKVATFYLKISENAVSGNYPIEFHLTSDGTGTVENAVIEVDGKPNPVVSAEDMEVKQGGETSFNLSVSNHGTDVSSDTVITLSNPDMSLSPSKIHLGPVNPGETKERTVDLDAGENLDNGPSKVDAAVEYRDGSENLNKQSSFSSLVLENAEIVVSQIDTEEAYIGSETRVMVELENTGAGEASKISSQLSCENANVKTSKAFVGSLDSDESVPTVYQVVPDSKKVGCDVKISYSDSGEEVTNESFVIEASRERTDILPIVGILAILTISGVYYWRRRNEES